LDFVALVYGEVTTTSPTSPFETFEDVTAVICVKLSTVKLAATMPLNVTLLTEKNPAPVMTTVVPPVVDPFETFRLDTDMTGQYVQALVFVALV
jgi:hypothetical protein